MKEKNTKANAFIAGSFTLVSLIVFVYALMWIRGFRLQPEYSFFVSFNSPPLLQTGMPIIYKGVDIGEVSLVRLSDDNSKSVVKLDIHQEDLYFPVDSVFEVKTKGLLGQSYLSIDTVDSELEAQVIESDQMVQGEDLTDFIKMKQNIYSFSQNLNEDFQDTKLVYKVANSVKQVEETSKKISSLTQKLDHVLNQERPFLKLFFGDPMKGLEEDNK